MSDQRKPPEPMTLVKHSDVGLNLNAPHPGSTSFVMYWGKTEGGAEQLVVEFDRSFWERQGDINVIVDGVPMTKRHADMLLIKRRLDEIETRVTNKPVEFK